MSGFVYFAGCSRGDGTMRVKIGFTRRHPTERVRDFQPGSPEELDVLCYIDGNLQLERKLHETFAGCRIHNEWFSPFGLMERLVRRLMQEGGGARAVTPYVTFKIAMFETVYDWAPTPGADEDFELLIESADTTPWDDDFADILDKRLAEHRLKKATPQ